MNREYIFNTFNNYILDGISEGLNTLNQNSRTPVILCIGSDLVIGDCLGPLVGTFLKNSGIKSFIYGTLNATVTAKEIEYADFYIKSLHPESFIIAIDAGVGKEEDVGLIKLTEGGIFPGKGVDKNFGEIGDVGIIGVVASKSIKNYNLFNTTRFNLVYNMAEKIAEGIKRYINSLN